MLLAKMLRLLSVAMIAAGMSVALETSEVQCSEDASWGAGLLQESYLVSHKISTDAAAEGPLTDNLKAEGFSTLQVPFGISVFLFFGFMILLLTLHECYVSTGHKPLLTSETGGGSLFQSVYLFESALIFVSTSLLAPLSLDYAIAMDQSATASGLFLGSGTVFSTLAVVCGRALTKEQDWDQAFARRLYVLSNVAGVILYMMLALLTQSSVHWSLEHKRIWFWLSQVVNGLATAANSLPMISWSTMWNKLTPQREKTFWMICTQSARSLGFLLGPVVFAVLSRTVSQGRDVSPISMMAWSFIALMCFFTLSTFLAALVVPTRLTIDFDQETEKDPKAHNEPEMELEVRPEQLPPAEREKMVWLQIYYALERPFSIAAVEVATIMLLEVAYGWSPERCGFAFIVIASASLFLTAVSTFLLNNKLVSESMVFFTSAASGLCGVALLFDFPGLGPWSLLVADAVVYGGASVANGIGMGWACRAATPGTSYNIEAYRLRTSISISVSRFSAPIVARFLIDFGGRNLYAIMQLLFCGMGTFTVYKSVSLVWKATSTFGTKGFTEPRK